MSLTKKPRVSTTDNADAAGVDRISSLPNNVMDNILTSLPIGDAARTSVLSKRWRFNWTKIPNLIFDDTLCTSTQQSSAKSNLLKLTYQALLTHHGPIHSFTLFTQELESSHEIEQIILFLMRKEVKEFKFHIQGEGGDLHTLPYSLYTLPQLTHLSLQSCILRFPSTFDGLGKLVSLALYEVHLSSFEFSVLIGTCLLLETLTFQASFSTEYLHILAPKLKHLCLTTHFTCLSSIKAPLLTSFSLTVRKSVEGIKQIRMPNASTELYNFPTGIENLHMDYYYMKCLVAGYLQPDLFDKLKVLKLSLVCFDDVQDVKTLLFLIGRCHNLRKVTFDAFHRIGLVSEQAEKLYKDLSNCDASTTFHQIRHAEMRLISGSWCELEFIKFILAESFLLEKLIVTPNVEEVADGGLRLLTQITRFRRASSVAEIVFID